MRDEPELLEDDADPPPEAGQAAARHGDDILAEQPDQAAAWPLGEVEELEERRLARTRGAGQEVEAALAQRKAEVRQRLGARAVAQAHIVELDDTACGAQPPASARTQARRSMAWRSAPRKPAKRAFACWKAPHVLGFGRASALQGSNIR